MTNIYHATPYDISSAGFYFRTFEDYLEKSASHRNEYGDPVEEYEIQFIDGENCALFSAIGVNLAKLKLWFDEFEHLDDYDAVKAIYLAEHLSCTADEVLGHLDDVYLFECTPLEYAESYVGDTGLLNEIPEHLRYYFDIEAFARDMVLGGDITQVEIMGRSWIAQPL
jgi:antirestriction protein